MVEVIVKLLSTVMLPSEGLLLVMVMILPSMSMLSMENSVSERLLKVLIQVMFGSGKPSAVQVREREAGLSSSMLTGDIAILGGTKTENAENLMTKIHVVSHV